MNKVNFPIGVELPLRGGGVAVLYEFLEGQWFGRMRGPAGSRLDKWEGDRWQANGVFDEYDHDGRFDILPPKRKAWVCWTPNDGATLFRDELVVMAIKANSPECQWQEITEP